MPNPLGEKYVGRLTQMLQNQPNANNGTALGALAHALQSGLLGYSQGQDEKTESDAYGALTKGAGAKPWVNPDTGETVGTAGGREGAIYALQGQQGNPVAGRLAKELMMGQIQDQQSQERFNTQQAAQNERLANQQQFQNDRMDRQFAQQDKTLAAQLANRERVAQTQAQGKASTAGKFYAVQTGNGVMLLDKATGTAVMMGQDAQGNPVQIGNSFRPAFNPRTGQPVATPTPEMVGGQNPAIPGQPSPQNPQGIQPPKGIEFLPEQGAQPPLQGQQLLPQTPPQGGPQGQSQIPPQIQQQAQGLPQGVTPLMSPSIDPTAQENVRRAQKIGESQGKREGSRHERLKAANAQMRQFTAEHDIVQDDIGRALEIAERRRATGMWSTMSDVPLGDSHDLKQMLGSIKAHIGFDKLQNMRDSSPTGGALGAISEREISLLQAALGSLEQSQSYEQFSYNMNRLRDVLSKSKIAIEQAYAQDYGSAYQPATEAPSKDPQGPANVDDLLQKYGAQ